MNEKYRTRNRIRVLTSTALFDGHDVAINLIRRLLQAAGAEVIHLGHSRSVPDIVHCALQEDVHAMAVTSYQGGHLEFFQHLLHCLGEQGASHIRVFAGGGATILPAEREELESLGVARVYTPEDGRTLGLQGMVEDLLKRCDYPIEATQLDDGRNVSRDLLLARRLSRLELGTLDSKGMTRPGRVADSVPVIGLTGPGGAGKSSLLDSLLEKWLKRNSTARVAVLSIDPSLPRFGGALLGDRLRINASLDPRVFMRSMATRGAGEGLAPAVQGAISLFENEPFKLIVIETAGTGQSDYGIAELVDRLIYVMTSDFGSAAQLEKINLLYEADFIAFNKFDRMGALDTLRLVRKQFQRNRQLWNIPLDRMPVWGTVAVQPDDAGVDALANALFDLLENDQSSVTLPAVTRSEGAAAILPPTRQGYLEMIVDCLKHCEEDLDEQAGIASRLYQIQGVVERTRGNSGDETSLPISELEAQYMELESRLHPGSRALLAGWKERMTAYRERSLFYPVRDRVHESPNYIETLSGLTLPRTGLPRLSDWGDRLRWAGRENLPGHFPYTAGVYPYRRSDEAPMRMVVGEGGPEKSNRRFHLLSRGRVEARLSTAFDPVTIYGADPEIRPDIFGKVGNSGVSVSTLDDVKKLYSGFDLCAPHTSVSLTINGPAAPMLALFFNAAIDQQCEKYIRAQGLTGMVEEQRKKLSENGYQPIYDGPRPDGHDGLGLLLLGISGDQVLPEEVYNRIRSDTLSRLRGTVQADILKEEQAQNICLFPTPFALKMMGDIQEFFIQNGLKNFYSISVSGYHMAEAGANPITQLSFALANAFTYIEYFKSRGMEVDDFARNFSFFFSSGMDPEYSVLARTARRIWARALKYCYGAGERSQMLKCHFQTSGRSLQAEDIDFNDIRTTLQALYPYFDSCNSLHTNAYDEPVTTPTRESVRRAMAIQWIILKEFGLSRVENLSQGSFLIEELTDLVESEVLKEFQRLSALGGVLGAMETHYQRDRIQEESLRHERLKQSPEYPLVGVNVFRDENQTADRQLPLSRASEEERRARVREVKEFKRAHAGCSQAALSQLQSSLREGVNCMDILLKASRSCTLGQMVEALYGVGGRYRRSL